MAARLNYNNQDYLNLFAIYGECNKNVRRTCHIFAIRYPHKQKQTRRTLRRIINNFIANGSVKGIQNKRKPVVYNQNVEIAILGYFRAQLRLSIGQAVRESGLSSGTIHRI